MTVPFENDTGNIVRKLARKSLKSEKRRNLMVVIAVALASCLICFSIVMALSTRQIEKNHVEDTYEAVYTKITEEDVSSLKGLDDFSRVGAGECQYACAGCRNRSPGHHRRVCCDTKYLPNLDQ